MRRACMCICAVASVVSTGARIQQVGRGGKESFRGHIASDTLVKTMATAPLRGQFFLWGQAPWSLAGAGAECGPWELSGRTNHVCSGVLYLSVAQFHRHEIHSCRFNSLRSCWMHDKLLKYVHAQRLMKNPYDANGLTRNKHLMQLRRVT